MTPQAIFSMLFDYVAQSTAVLLAGAVCGLAVAAYITSAAYLALRAGYERGILVALSRCLEAGLQKKSVSESAGSALTPVHGPRPD